METENMSLPSPNINIPPSSLIHTLRNLEKLYLLTQNLSPSSPTIPSPSEPAYLGLESPSTTSSFSSEGPPLSAEAPNSTKD